MTTLPLCNHVTVTLDEILIFSELERGLLTHQKLLCENHTMAEQSQQLKNASPHVKHFNITS